MEKVEIFEKAPVRKAIFALALPSVLSSIVTIAYNLVDVFFVGQTGDPNQVAAVALAMPVFMLMMACGSVLGIGGGSLISRLLGQKRHAQVKKTSAFCFYMCLVMGLVCNMIVLSLMPFILKWIGCTDATRHFAEQYLTICAFGAYFLLLQTAFSFIVRSEGASKESMFGIMLGTIVNIILDPIFILHLKMGVVGAAIATVIGAFVAAAYYVIYLLWHKKTYLSISLRWWRPEFEITKEVFCVGLPPSLAHMLMSFSNILLNNFLVRYGDDVIAAMGITMRIFSFIPIIQIGFSAGIQPLIGYNYGAKNKPRLEATLAQSRAFMLISGICFFAVLEAFSPILTAAFIDNQQVVAHATYFLRVQASTTPVLGFFFLAMATLQALGKSTPSLVLSVCRQGFIFIPTLFLTARFFGLKGIVWSQPVADVFSILVSFFLVRAILKKHLA